MIIGTLVGHYKISMMEQIFGIIAMSLGLVVTMLGFPMQILKNWKSKSADDLSLPMWILFFLSSLTWVIYGYFREIPDYFLVIPSLFGSVLTGVIIVQIVLYKK